MVGRMRPPHRPEILPRRRWSEEDDARIRAEYPTVGRALAAALGRSAYSLYMRASRLGVLSPKSAITREQDQLAESGAQRCNTCRQVKPIAAFYARTHGHKCRECVEKVKRTSISSRLEAQLTRAGRNPGSTLTLAEAEAIFVAQGGRCHYSGRLLTFAERGCPQLVSIDRLDSSLPYTKANCVLACHHVNLMKHAMPVASFLSFCRDIAQKHQ